MAAMMSAVRPCAQLFGAPAPPLKNESVGAHAMSPAAAVTRAAASAGGAGPRPPGGAHAMSPAAAITGSAASAVVAAPRPPAIASDVNSVRRRRRLERTSGSFFVPNPRLLGPVVWLHLG